MDTFFMDKKQEMYDGPQEVNWMNIDTVPYLGKTIYGEKYGLGVLVRLKG